MDAADVISFSTRCAQMKDGSTQCWLPGKESPAPFDAKKLKERLR